MLRSCVVAITTTVRFHWLISVVLVQSRSDVTVSKGRTDVTVSKGRPRCCSYVVAITTTVRPDVTVSKAVLVAVATLSLSQPRAFLG